MITFARGVEVDRVLIQPKHLVNELAKIMAQTFPKNIDIQTVFSPEVWTVSGDATQLHQILLNLCVNARDAMPNGGPLTVGAENVIVDEQLARMNPGAQLGPHVIVRVSDSGTGMSPETMDKIFDPFFTTKEVGKGTGLGLATVMGIVKGHGGFLSLQSEIGIGTTFRVYLAGSVNQGTVSAAPEDLRTMAPASTCFVVDDESPIRVKPSSARSNPTATVPTPPKTAPTHSRALASSAATTTSCFTDLAMGQMDGIALVRSLRKVNPNVRVIVSSGHAQGEHHRPHQPRNCDHLLDKLINAGEVPGTPCGASSPAGEGSEEVEGRASARKRKNASPSPSSRPTDSSGPPRSAAIFSATSRVCLARTVSRDAGPARVRAIVSDHERVAGQLAAVS